MSYPITFLIGIVLFALSGCQSMTPKAVVQAVKPTATVAGSHLTSLDFNQIGLLFDIDIHNPNAVAITLAHFNYELLVNGVAFLHDHQSRPTELKAHDHSRIQVPVTLNIPRLTETITSLKGAKEVGYELKLGLGVDLPLLGVVQLPLSESGTVPIPQLPRVQMAGVQMKSMGLAGAELNLRLEVENPNAFTAALNTFNYTFQVNGQNWASGTAPQPLQIKPNGKSTLTLPIQLNLASGGLTALQALTGGKTFNYALSGHAEVTTDHRLLSRFQLPFNRSGQMSLSR